MWAFSTEEMADHARALAYENNMDIDAFMAWQDRVTSLGGDAFLEDVGMYREALAKHPVAAAG